MIALKINIYCISVKKLKKQKTKKYKKIITLKKYQNMNDADGQKT